MLSYGINPKQIEPEKLSGIGLMTPSSSGQVDRALRLKIGFQYVFVRREK